MRIKTIYLPLPEPEPRGLAGIGYGNGAYGSWVYPDPEFEPAVEVLLGVEEEEDMFAGLTLC